MFQRQKSFPHINFGGKRQNQKTRGFEDINRWCEVRLDIYTQVSPDMVAQMLEMREIPSGSLDALFSSRKLEHLYAHEVPLALKKFYRVLKDYGFAVITYSDVQSVDELVAQGKHLKPCYICPSDPIATIDTLWRQCLSLARGN